MLGKQVDYTNSPTCREDFSYDEKQFAEFEKKRNLFETKTLTQA